MPSAAARRKPSPSWGADEVDLERAHISWISPVARALLKARIGDVVEIRTPAGLDQIEVLDIRY